MISQNNSAISQKGSKETEVTKPRFESPDLAKENIQKIAKLFPGAVAEGKVNFDLLRTLLGEDIMGDEAYEFTWVGKHEAIRDAGRPIRKTLRPCIEESKNWDTTENLYIEGDNLDVLRLLQESYLGKVKMIYIDPPYNTGNDFVYRDNFTQSREDYDEQLGVYSEDGVRLFRNTESNGRFHSDWCSMIYPRLMLARNLLLDNGVIFISIDDHELANLIKICNEIFGEENFLATFVWQRRASSAMADKLVSVDHEYIVAYQRGGFMSFNGKDKDYANYSNPDNDPNGDWTTGDLTVGMTKEQRPNQFYNLVDPETGNVYPANPSRVWAYIPESMNKLIKLGRVIFPEVTTKRPMLKRYKKDLKIKVDPLSTWIKSLGEQHQQGLLEFESGLNAEGTREMQNLFGETIFNYSKPVSLITSLIKYSTSKDDIILDPFAGSCTTAQAVMELNNKDVGHRRFICIQLQEPLANQKSANGSLIKTIADIGKERIRLAGEKIKKSNEQTVQNLDFGFRVLKLDDTNMKDVYYVAGDYTQDLLGGLESNIKEDRSDMDLLIGCLLDWGLPLSLPHTKEKIDGITFHTYNNGDLIACFAHKISDKVVREIAKRQPLRAVFRDSSFSSSPEKINVEEIFKLFAPNTSVKVL